MTPFMCTRSASTNHIRNIPQNHVSACKQSNFNQNQLSSVHVNQVYIHSDPAMFRNGALINHRSSPRRNLEMIAMIHPNQHGRIPSDTLNYNHNGFNVANSNGMMMAQSLSAHSPVTYTPYYINVDSMPIVILCPDNVKI